MQRLVEQHEGRVHAESAGPGTGSRFVVRLPRLEAPAVVPRPRTDRLEPAVRRRVLLVEDNPDMRHMVHALLEMRGHEVHDAPDGAAALDAAARLAPEIALIDIGLPGLDGYELARRLRAMANGSPLRLIALTGYGRAQERRRAAEAGFDDHLVKPVESDTLLRVLERETPPPA